MSYDPKCLLLAEYFLPSEASDELKQRLTQCIQDSVESWLEAHKPALLPTSCAGEKRLYRFYNMDISDYGAPFALCDFHRTVQRIPDHCVIHEIADSTQWPCQFEQ